MTVATVTPLAAREAAALLPTYRRRGAAFVSGCGTYLTDEHGHTYLDFLSGLAVTSLGHAHPAVTAAISAQAGRLTHVSNLYATEPQIALAERLQTTLGWPDGKAFFANSGAEANEAAIKLARRHGKQISPDKVRVVALSGGFHGRTLGALAVTGNPLKHAPFAPLGDWVTHVAHDDAAALDAAVDDNVCAIMVEVIQGEAGVVEVPADVLAAARAAADRVAALLIVDEVQTGIGRLGAWYGWQTTAITPDVVCLAKALANGLPIGAIVARGVAATAFGPGDHATTFGGGPVVCAAANAVIDTIQTDDLLGAAVRQGEGLQTRLAGLVAQHTIAAGTRGRGLLQAMTLHAEVATAVAVRAHELGLVINDVGPATLRFAPPLTVSDDELDQMTQLLDQALASVGNDTGFRA